MNNEEPNEIKPFAVYSINQAADLVGVDRKAIYTLGNKGTIPLVKIGKGYKVLGENLLRFMGSASISQMRPNTNMGAAVPGEDYNRKVIDNEGVPSLNQSVKK